MTKLSFSIIRIWLLRKKARLVFKSNPLPGDYRRIYHFHIRKSAGTSVNAAFWRLGGKGLTEAGRDSLMVSAKYVFVRHNRDLIRGGAYHYANSHAPYWEFELPPQTFTFTVFRDPLQRLISQYRYYHFNAHHPEAHLLDPMNANVITYIGWLGNSFGDFLDRYPEKYRQNQLYTFSEKLDIDEAIMNARKLTRIYFHDELPVLAEELGTIIGQNLELTRERAFPVTAGAITPEEEAKARQLLRNEQEFYDRLQLLRTQKEPKTTMNKA